MNYYIYENTPDFLCEHMALHGKFNMICQHYHSSYEILFMTGGVRYAFFNNGMHRVESGDIIIIKPYTLHFTENRESDYFERYVINFSDKLLQMLLSESECNELLSQIHTGLVHVDGDNFIMLKMLFEKLANDGTDNRLSCKKTSARLITLLDIISKLPSFRSDSDANDVICSGQLIDALNYVNHHFTEDMSLDFIVDYAHMSKANFCRTFKKETGNTFLQYLSNLRVAYAHSLLLETDMTIQKIADKTGFSSVLHFDRVFKNTHGITPSALRKQYK